jgi:SAM-dependent methyltransferase
MANDPVLCDRQAGDARVPETCFVPGPRLLEVFPAKTQAEFELLWHGRLARSVTEQDGLVPVTDSAFTIPGFCAVCGKPTEFSTDFMYASPDAQGFTRPAWRERQICHCHLNCRQRSCFHLLTESLDLEPDAVVYCTEQGELFRRIKQVFPQAVGSEYVGSKTPLGSITPEGVRNEDITRLTFPDASFDCIFSLDVMEHVPDYKAGFREMARCLKPGGRLLLTVPLHLDQDQTVVRASVNPDGSLTHHLEPVYHGDPLDPKGTLCFNDFGWDLMGQLREIGFADATVFLFTAPHYGYAGLQFVILATRDKAVASGANGPLPASHQSPLPNRLPIRVTSRSARAQPLPPAEKLRRQAREFFAQGTWAQAADAFQRLVKLCPDDLEAWRGLCDSTRRQGHQLLASLLAQEALERHPEWTAQLAGPDAARPSRPATPPTRRRPWQIQGRRREPAPLKTGRERTTAAPPCR